MSVAYHIRDEPTGSRSHALIVNPFWALLALMLAGSWMSAPLFGLNAALLRGPTWRRELALVALLLICAPLLFIALTFVADHQWLSQRLGRYVYLLIVLCKLAVAYWLFFLQQNTYALYEYFGGTAHETRRGSVGMVAVVAGMMFRSSVLAAFQTPLWRLMVQ